MVVGGAGNGATPRTQARQVVSIIAVTHMSRKTEGNMKRLGSEIVEMHELVFDALEVGKLRSCGILTPWCVAPAHLQLSVVDMLQTADLLEANCTLAGELRNLAGLLTGRNCWERNADDQSTRT